MPNQAAIRVSNAKLLSTVLRYMAVIPNHHSSEGGCFPRRCPIPAEPFSAHLGRSSLRRKRFPRPWSSEYFCQRPPRSQTPEGRPTVSAPASEHNASVFEFYNEYMLLTCIDQPRKLLEFHYLIFGFAGFQPVRNYTTQLGPRFLWKYEERRMS